MATQLKIGHAHLKVRDLDRSIAFYQQHLGLRLIERVGDHYAFLSGGAFHHEIALQHVGMDAPQPPARGTGLYHVAFEAPDRRAFAAVYRDLRQSEVAVALVDHYISWAMYFDDPDGNGLEVYWDTRGEPNGRPLWAGDNAPLAEETVLAALAE